MARPVCDVADGPRRGALLFGAEPELALPPGYLVERETEFVTELQVPLG